MTYACCGLYNPYKSTEHRAPYAGSVTVKILHKIWYLQQVAIAMIWIVICRAFQQFLRGPLGDISKWIA